MAVKVRFVIFGAFFLILNHLIIAVEFVEVGRSNGADMSSSEETCPVRTYFSSVVPGCVGCPEDCHSEALVDIKTCLSACSIEPEKPTKPVKVGVNTKNTAWPLALVIALPVVCVVVVAAVAGGYRLRNQRRRNYIRYDIDVDPNDAPADNEEGNLVEEEPALGLTSEENRSSCESGKPVTQDSLPGGSKNCELGC